MRYIMKGGVWKNSEDQILKAAIMKYGLNQWSRISSLLQRKSAKQCKQRWYEWLDPSIKKTQWSRAQDQKLLQLARVFPSQWRTIAPFVGRTPTQCFERYQKLLDIAQGKSPQESEDLKKLRPGQIDPNPQTKPARLDPIDMDEDEKEMLAEVRVRLANTKGKKAKRKEREKIIEEARRLAQLQKIRQLEMAGVDNIPTAKQLKRLRQKQDIDYNSQIPFKREIPEFVYKVQETEVAKNNSFASTISLQTLEGKRRDVEEELQRKLDKKRLKKLKDRDFKSMLDIKNRFDKPVSNPISLPQPQLNEKDLEDMKKYNITTPLNSMMISNATPSHMTPENKIMLAAKINYSLNHREIMTPIGEHEDEGDLMDGVSGLNYLKEIEKKQRDPNRLRSVDRIISERVKTPSASGNQWEHDQDKIKNLLKGLSKPQNLIEFQIPEQDEQEEQEQEMIDAEELQKKQREQAQLSQQIRMEMRNQALKRNLPRIRNIPTTLNPSQTNIEAENLIELELISMLYSDTIDYPPSSFNLPQNHTFRYLEPLTSEQRQQAQKLISQEFEAMNFQKVESEIFYNNSKNHVICNMDKKKAEIQEQQLNEKDKKTLKYKQTLINLPIYREVEKDTEHAEKKLKKYLAGYQKIVNSKIDEINSLQQELSRLQMERNALEMIASQEESCANSRLHNQEAYYRLIYNSI